MIDTDVLVTAAGEDSLDPRSVECMEFLRQILRICHSVVVSEELEKEWDCHKSRASERWRAEMEDSKKVLRPTVEMDRMLRRAIKKMAGSFRVTTSLAKDAHLVEAARQTDKLVASADNRARNGFSQCKSAIPWLGDVVWVNPATDEDLVDWLEQGATSDSWRKL